MANQLRILTWNCRRATESSAAWDYLLELAPDVALLQEVGAIPPRVLTQFDACQEPSTGSPGKPLPFRTAVLVRGRIGRRVPLKGPAEWVDRILVDFAGDLLAFELSPRNAPPLKVISSYSPSWRIPDEYLEGVDLGALRRTQNKGVWLTDVLLAALEYAPPDPDDRWAIGGDFNLSETFDQDSRFAGGNGPWLRRMADLGLTQCLRKTQGQLVPTFRSPRGGFITHQIDHLFVTLGLGSRLVACETGSRQRVFDRGISDHLPVAASFVF